MSSDRLVVRILAATPVLCTEVKIKGPKPKTEELNEKELCMGPLPSQRGSIESIGKQAGLQGEFQFKKNTEMDQMRKLFERKLDNGLLLLLVSDSCFVYYCSTPDRIDVLLLLYY